MKRIYALLSMIFFVGQRESVYSQVPDKLSTGVSNTFRLEPIKKLIGKESKLNTNWQQGGIFEGKNPYHEIIEKRSEYTKKFSRTDGKIDVIFGGPFHYLDKSNVWQDINLNIKSGNNSRYKYFNEENRFESRFAENLNDGAEITSNNKTIAFGINPTVSASIWKPSLDPGNRDVVLNANIITFKNVYNNIHLEYQLNANELQHRLQFLNKDIFNGITDHYIEVSEEMQLPANSILHDSIGKIKSNRVTKGNIYVVVGNDTVFTILQSRIWDAKGSQYEGFILTENSVAISSSNKIKLTSKIPTVWLLAPDRSYPMVFDPTFYIGGFNSYSSNYRYPFNTC